MRDERPSEAAPRPSILEAPPITAPHSSILYLALHSRLSLASPASRISLLSSIPGTADVQVRWYPQIQSAPTPVLFNLNLRSAFDVTHVPHSLPDEASKDQPILAAT